MRPPLHVAKGSALFCILVATAGCGGGGSGGAQPTMCFGANVVAAEKNDYAFSSTITLPPVTVASMSNLTFDWSGLTHDFEGHHLDPAKDLGMAIVMAWNLPLADFQKDLNADALFTKDLILSPPLSLDFTDLPAGATSAHLYDFTINGTAVTPAMINQYFDATMYSPANASFIVGVQTGTDLGRNLRMLQAFNLDTSSTTTNVVFKDDSTKLTYTANLHDLTITGVPGGTPTLKLDWSHMTTNGLGRAFTDGYVTSAVVGHYAQTPTQLESQFLDLDSIALATYRADIESGSVLDFTTLKDANGASFPGVDNDGTWLVGLICGNCRNPAPWYMTILKPCSM
ncbi:MAG TPA: hypothetical protein VN962_16140 [Polyangia bacterium]|nr:hypothetical protein [Polyangia bacterium]